MWPVAVYAFVLQLEKSRKNVSRLAKQSNPSSAETSHTLLVRHNGEFLHLYPLFKDIEESFHCAQGEESKRTSWILRVTIIRFIYIQGESSVKPSLSIWVSITMYVWAMHWLMHWHIVVINSLSYCADWCTVIKAYYRRPRPLALPRLSWVFCLTSAWSYEQFWSEYKTMQYMPDDLLKLNVKWIVSAIRTL